MEGRLAFFPSPILAVETSCDETSAAVVVEREVRSNVVSSQIELHRRWGGVVPEAAARAHVEAILPVIEEALENAGITLGQIRAFAATNRPGLVGALSVGVSAARALSIATGRPLVPIHHLEGHLLSVYAIEAAPSFPMLSLIASGGHTELVLVRAPGDYEIVGETRDDAAGEAFDKASRLMGLGYPGGRAIQEAAQAGDAKRYPLPRGLRGETSEFSFSGLKTAVLRLVEREGSGLSVPDAAASVQEAIVSVLTDRTLATAETHRVRSVALVGGVAANLALRARLADGAARVGVAFLTPPSELCTDNAAMIGLAASWRLAAGTAGGSLDVLAVADLPAT